MEKWLAIFDLSGIQKFIFATNKMKEIIGGSTVVHNALFEELPKADCVFVAVGHSEYRSMSTMQLKELFKERRIFSASHALTHSIKNLLLKEINRSSPSCSHSTSSYKELMVDMAVTLII